MKTIIYQGREIEITAIRYRFAMLGRIIKSARKTARLTQKQLGLLCGYSEASAERIVQFWEQGMREPPLEKLRTLANALHITLDELIP